MQHIIVNPVAVDEVDLTTPTSTAKYELGTVIEIKEKVNSSSETASKAVKKFIYVKSHGALTAYQPYVVGTSSTAGSEVITAAPATLAAPGSLVCVPQVGFTSGYYGWVQIQGDASVLMTAETYAAGDYLQILNSGTAMVVDGTTGSPAITVNSSAICKSGGTTAAAKACYLIGRPAVVAAT